jgi:hypothetical protein
LGPRASEGPNFKTKRAKSNFYRGKVALKYSLLIKFSNNCAKCEYSPNLVTLQENFTIRYFTWSQSYDRQLR